MRTILASVSDKTGLIDFAIRLQNSSRFIASGGTASALRNAGISVTEAAEYAKSAEILGGRVKTLNPIIHAGILARPEDSDRAELAKLGIDEIDIVIVNLYPFEAAVNKPNAEESECIENIDIGGVALLRAAAKNYKRVTVLCDYADYDTVAAEIENLGAVQLQTRKKLAAKAFALCTRYDSAITLWFSEGSNLGLYGFNGRQLRYGENPHQKAWFYSKTLQEDVLGGKLIQGKTLSYNNILDADAAWKTVSLFENPAAAAVKHLTPCGIAELGTGKPDINLSSAIKAVIDCDPVSVYGGIIAVNRVFDENCFYALKELFVECIIAPKFTEEAKKLLTEKKNCRVVENPVLPEHDSCEFRSVTGGFLQQEIDLGDTPETEYKNAAERPADQKEMKMLKFAWKACITVKSNAILLAAPIDPANPERGMCSVGIGSGQTNRVDAARQAIARAGTRAKGAVLASDAFFPFPDTIQEAAKAGITAVIQPGGSIRDDLAVNECNKNNIAMVLTGQRHFKH